MFIIFLMLFSQTQPVFHRPVHPETDFVLLKEQVKNDQFKPVEWVEKIIIYTKIGELLSADKLIFELVEIASDNPIFIEAKMVILWKNHDDLDGALALGTALLEHVPNHLTLRVNLARIYFSKNEYSAAINMLLDQLERSHLTLNDWSLLYMILGKTGESKDFMVDILQKIKINPDSGALKQVYFNLLVRFGKYDIAKQFLDQFPELKESNKDIGRFYESIKEFK